MFEFTDLIYKEGGQWAETEILGNRGIVKVRASVATLTTIAGTTGFRLLPKDRLDDSLTDLTSDIKDKLRQEVLDAGYTASEFDERFPGGLTSMRDLLRFLATRRLKPRRDKTTRDIVLDGPVQTPRTIESVDAEVK